jgi:catechol 2,3-dioxygenase-like lactoylglutathione lyase family enzyme
VIDGGLVEFVRDLKRQPGGDVGVHGSISVAQALLAAGVVDEIRLVFAPAIVGSGRRLLDGLPSIEVELIRSEISRPAMRWSTIASIIRRAGGRPQEDAPMSRLRFDHVGITVANLDTVTAFFVGLGFEVEGRMALEGEFVDTVIGIPNSRSEIVTLRPPVGGTGLELSSFTRPNHEPGSPNAMSTELGLRNVMFEVDDLDGILDRLAGDGYGLVGGIGQYEKMWRMAYVRGPEGIIVALAQRID